MAVRTLIIRKLFGSGLATVAMAAVLMLGSALLPARTSGGTGLAAAANCPQVEVIFARGRFESPGAGILGNSFINTLGSKLGGKSMGTYAVKYPADSEIDIGANDMSRRIQYMINTCSDTRLVLGGYSLGAAVTDVVLAVPMSAFGFDNPLPAGADQHIAAIVFFGNGSQWMGPFTNLNPLYNDRTIELCHGADPVCNPADPNTWKENWPQHLANAYIQAGMVNQAADYAASKV